MGTFRQRRFCQIDIDLPVRIYDLGDSFLQRCVCWVLDWVTLYYAYWILSRVDLKIPEAWFIDCDTYFQSVDGQVYFTCDLAGCMSTLFCTTPSQILHIWHRYFITTFLTICEAKWIELWRRSYHGCCRIVQVILGWTRIVVTANGLTMRGHWFERPFGPFWWSHLLGDVGIDQCLQVMIVVTARDSSQTESRLLSVW